MEILSLNPRGDPDLTAYLQEHLRTKKTEQQNNTFWFPSPEKPGNPEDHTQLQTRTLKQLIQLKEKERSIHKRAQNPAPNPLIGLIGLTHF